MNRAQWENMKRVSLAPSGVHELTRSDMSMIEDNMAFTDPTPEQLRSWALHNLQSEHLDKRDATQHLDVALRCVGETNMQVHVSVTDDASKASRLTVNMYDGPGMSRRTLLYNGPISGEAAAYAIILGLWNAREDF